MRSRPCGGRCWPSRGAPTRSARTSTAAPSRLRRLDESVSAQEHALLLSEADTGRVPLDLLFAGVERRAFLRLQCVRERARRRLQRPVEAQNLGSVERHPRGDLLVVAQGDRRLPGHDQSRPRAALAGEPGAAVSYDFAILDVVDLLAEVEDVTRRRAEGEEVPRDLYELAVLPLTLLDDPGDDARDRLRLVEDRDRELPTPALEHEPEAGLEHQVLVAPRGRQGARRDAEPMPPRRVGEGILLR